MALITSERLIYMAAGVVIATLLVWILYAWISSQRGVLGESTVSVDAELTSIAGRLFVARVQVYNSGGEAASISQVRVEWPGGGYCSKSVSYTVNPAEYLVFSVTYDVLVDCVNIDTLTTNKVMVIVVVNGRPVGVPVAISGPLPPPSGTLSSGGGGVGGGGGGGGGSTAPAPTPPGSVSPAPAPVPVPSPPSSPIFPIPVPLPPDMWIG